MTQDRPFLGILLMLGFCVLAPMGDALAKVLGTSLSIGLLVLARFAVQATILVPIVILSNRRWHMSPRILRLTILRTVLHIIGITAMFTSLKFLPLADAIAIVFVMPFIMLVLGKYVLNEEVGLRRILACLVGFIGTLFVVQPSFAEVGLPALLPMVVAVVFSLIMLITRQMAKQVDPLSLQASSGVLAVVVLLPPLLWGNSAGVAGTDLTLPQGNTLWLLLLIGVLGTLAHLMMTWSLRFAPSATLAPMQYLEIPIATAIGWLIFSDLPNGLAAIGITITMAAGLYIIYREQAMSRTKPVTTYPPLPNSLAAV
jgi:drug/metabolite transporter (DMT)-like permease